MSDFGGTFDPLADAVGAAGDGRRPAGRAARRRRAPRRRRPGRRGGHPRTAGLRADGGHRCRRSTRSTRWRRCRAWPPSASAPTGGRSASPIPGRARSCSPTPTWPCCPTSCGSSPTAPSTRRRPADGPRHRLVARTRGPAPRSRPSTPRRCACPSNCPGPRWRRTRGTATTRPRPTWTSWPSAGPPTCCRSCPSSWSSCGAATSCDAARRRRLRASSGGGRHDVRGLRRSRGLHRRSRCSSTRRSWPRSSAASRPSPTTSSPPTAGRVVKMIGDEVMFVAEGVQSGAELALALAEAYRNEPGCRTCAWAWPAGPVLEREGDVYGPVVNLASRIVGIAYPATVVVAGDVHHALADDPRFTFRPIRPHYLKDIGRVAPVDDEPPGRRAGGAAPATAERPGGPAGTGAALGPAPDGLGTCPSQVEEEVVEILADAGLLRDGRRRRASSPATSPRRELEAITDVVLSAEIDEDLQVELLADIEAARRLSRLEQEAQARGRGGRPRGRGPAGRHRGGGAGAGRGDRGGRPPAHRRGPGRGRAAGRRGQRARSPGGSSRWPRRPSARPRRPSGRPGRWPRARRRPAAGRSGPPVLTGGDRRAVPDDQGWSPASDETPS